MIRINVISQERYKHTPEKLCNTPSQNQTGIVAVMTFHSSNMLTFNYGAPCRPISVFLLQQSTSSPVSIGPVVSDASSLSLKHNLSGYLAGIPLVLLDVCCSIPTVTAAHVLYCPYCIYLVYFLCFFPDYIFMHFVHIL